MRLVQPCGYPSLPRHVPAAPILLHLLFHTSHSRASWQGGLSGGRFWDCNGAACDATVLQPFEARRFVYASQYAPTDPADFGGPSSHGERLWLTGRVSDAVSALLGPDSDCCGKDRDGGGGCGKCLLIRNPSAARTDWTAVLMKKGRCPPASPGCEAPKLHIDVAVPGYENLSAGMSHNMCGSAGVENTFISREQSGVCSSWLSSSDVREDASVSCSCDGLPSETLEQRILKNGCELFSAWGWTVTNPKLEFIPVLCPEDWAERVGGAFGVVGVQRPSDLSIDWMTIGLPLLVCGLLCFIGLAIRCWATRQDRKQLQARRMEKEKRRISRSDGSASSSASSASSSSGSETD
eukprot:CAMPEP_0171108772 /NCGR_PEP_ID=MMETSP0766_2-20121228/69566_1 /TAXON_ID=439317 /ORGANISM="Gambierdiscus australes, Strain CAWD 149" /LENGTH=350 /DNA_ID=CAMNT_0011570367 /DNA_START=22 /DNA_END=1074 /DNA_ORIENTATION=+